MKESEEDVRTGRHDDLDQAFSEIRDELGL
jgi:hypothetical protein